MDLVSSLIEEGYLKTPRIIKAFRRIKRTDFMSDESKGFAGADEAFSIGFGQTISQPLVVALMIEKLEPKEGDKILDIGSGSGWTTSLLSEIVGKQGKVFGIEVIPELVNFGKENTSKYNFVNRKIAKFICADGTKGYECEAPFDRILCSAAAFKNIPSAWKEQLKIGGRIVTPIDNSIWLFVKKTKDDFEETEFPGFIFVPLVSKS